MLMIRRSMRTRRTFASTPSWLSSMAAAMTRLSVSSTIKLRGFISNADHDIVRTSQYSEAQLHFQ
jgi:hypothetical protein